MRRLRRGRGFSYVDDQGGLISDPDTLTRIKSLAIPPAWREVWICDDPLGHLQATGTDAAGRKQYLYHSAWREQRDRAKYRRMVKFARALPRLRTRVGSDLDAAGLTRTRVLACAVRLLDLGMFRIGGEEYAEPSGGVGLATLRRQHVTVGKRSIVFDYPAKSGVRRVHEVADQASVDVVAELRQRRGGPDELLAWRDGRRWRGLRSEDINEYMKLGIGDDFSAKDFRTWNATVLAAALLARDHGKAATRTARHRAINECVRDVAELLGNTPAVARRAYIDPRIFDRYQSGWTIQPLIEASTLDRLGIQRRRRVELAVLDLLAEDERARPDSRNGRVHRVPVDGSGQVRLRKRHKG